MKRRALALVILAVGSVLVVGCGRNPTPPPVADKPDNPTSDGSGGVSPVKGATLATASTSSIVQLLKGLPTDKQPKPGPEGIIERNEAKTWLAENVIGKSLEFSLRVGAVEIEDANDGKYNVELLFLTKPETEEMQKLQSNVKISRIAVGKVPCEVQAWGPSPLWSDLDTAKARKRRELKGKQVYFKARVTEAEFLDGDDEGKLLLMLGLADVETLRAEDPPPVKVAVAPEKDSPKTTETPDKPNPVQPAPPPKALPKPITVNDVPPPPANPAGDMRELFVDEDGVFPRRRVIVPYLDGQPHGEARAYGPQRRLIMVERYERGQRQGERLIFYPSGKQLESLHYANGQPHGVVYNWFENGKVAFTMTWRNGVKDGPSAMYFENGKRMIEMDNVGGLAQGTRRHFTPEGVLFGLSQWEAGRQVGESQIIPDTPQLLASIEQRNRFSLLTKDHWTPQHVEQAAAPPGPARQIGKWVSLFNGKNLDGWWPNSDPRKVTSWEVRDGVLKGSGEGKHMGWLISEDGDYRDFHLRVEAKINAAGNSGIYFGVPKMRSFDFALPTGYEAQIAAEGDRRAKLKTGAIVFRSSSKGPGSTNQLHHATDEWFTMDLIVQGNRIITKVNGATTAEESLDPQRDQKLERGHLALQKHVDGPTIIEFRKIEVMRLADASAFD